MYDQQRLRPACAYAQSDQSLCWSFEYSMTVMLLTGHHLKFLISKGGCTGSSESTLVKMSNCWKSHSAAHISLRRFFRLFFRKLLPPMTVRKYSCLLVCENDVTFQYVKMLSPISLYVLMLSPISL